MDEPLAKSIQAAVRELEHLIGAPDEFFMSLLQESDWTFVIKLHTLLESAVTHLIVSELKRPELRDFVARLDMSSDVGSKLSLAKALNIMPKDDRGLIRLLSGARNHIVHNVDSHPFNLDGYLSSVSTQTRDEFLKNVSKNWDDPVEIARFRVDRRTFFLENSKLGFWFRGMGVLFNIYIQQRMAQLEVEHVNVAKALLELAVKSNKTMEPTR